MNFKLFDEVMVKNTSTLYDFVGSKSGMVVNVDNSKEVYEIEFTYFSLIAASKTRTRLRINGKDLEKVSN